MPRLAHLDDLLFPVEEHPVFVRIQNAAGERWLSVPDKKAIIGVSNGRVFAIVGSSYRLVTNREALDWGVQCCRSVFPETHHDEWDVGSVDAPATGGHCCIDLIHKSNKLDFSLLSPRERPDVFGPFVRVTNSYNTLRALTFDIGFFRKVCKNGLIAPDAIVQFKFYHHKQTIRDAIGFEVADSRLAKLKAAFIEQLRLLSSVRVPRGEHAPFVRAVLSLHPPQPLERDTKEAEEWKSLREHIGDLCDRYVEELGENAYAVFNAVTEFASHPPINNRVRRERHSLQRMAGTWLHSFSERCRQPDFHLANYVAELSALGAPFGSLAQKGAQ